MMGPPGPAEQPDDSVCVFCQTVLAPTDAAVRCPACTAAYHAECWQENGGCAVYGCERVPSVEARNPLEVPVSYWGLEQKACPGCGQSIQAAALRCRYCGATFDTARPASAGDFHRHLDARAMAPRLRRGVTWLLILALLTPTAPLAAMLGLSWYRRRRDAFEVAPSLYAGLARLGIAVALAQTALVLGVAALYTLTRRLR